VPLARLFAPRIVALAVLSVLLAHCSGSGGSATPKRVATPSPTPVASPGAIVFTGSTITNNVMTLPCDTTETFTVSQANYAGSLTLADNNPGQVALTPTPATGPASTVYTVLASSSVTNPAPSPFTITATGGGGVTQVLTINTVGSGTIGTPGQPQECNS